MAAAGAAVAGCHLVAHQRAAAVGEDRRTIDQARTLLLVAAGGEPSDAAAVCQHAAEDRGTAVAGGIADCWVAETMPEEATSEGPVREKSVSKRTDVGPRGCPGLDPGSPAEAGAGVIASRIAT